MKLSWRNSAQLGIFAAIVMTSLFFQNCTGGTFSAISGSSSLASNSSSSLSSDLGVQNSAARKTAGSHILSIAFAGLTRTYIMHVPPRYRDADPLPLMIVFHPNGGTGAGMESTTRFDAIADANKFLVAYPDSNPNDSTNDWATTGVDSDVDFSLAMISAIERIYSVNPGAIYISGYSKGGGMVQQLACSHTDVFAGAAVISENFNAPTENQCAPSKPIPFILFHGTADAISPYNGGVSSYNGGTTVSALQTAQYWVGANGCHSGPTSTYLPDILSDGMSVHDTERVWSNCKNAADVTFYTIQNGGHTWPGGGQKSGTGLGAISTELNASAIIWATFTGGGT